MSRRRLVICSVAAGVAAIVAVGALVWSGGPPTTVDVAVVVRRKVREARTASDASEIIGCWYAFAGKTQVQVGGWECRVVGPLAEPTVGVGAWYADEMVVESLTVRIDGAVRVDHGAGSSPVLLLARPRALFCRLYAWVAGSCDF